MPFMVLSVGLVVASTLLTYAVFTNESQSVPELVTVRLYDIEPSSNGLAHVSHHTEASINTSDTVLSSGLGNLGQSASLQAAVYAKQ